MATNPCVSSNRLCCLLAALLVGFCLLGGRVAVQGAVEMEQKSLSVDEAVMIVATTAQQQIDSKIEHLKKCACSHHRCSNMREYWPTCTKILGNDDVCGACDQGVRVNLDHGGVQTPALIDPENLPAPIAQSICLHQGLDNAFQQVGAAGDINTWTYFGSSVGMIRLWPSKARDRGLLDCDGEPHLGNCRRYDPRLRPWYIETVTSGGPKDIVILLDTSESMGQPSGKTTRLSLAVEMANHMLEYTAFSDYFAVIPFGGKSGPLVWDDLQEASNLNTKTLVKATSAVRLSGKPDLAGGFSAVFSMFRNSTFKSRTSQCQKIIILISDGHFCENPKDGLCPETPTPSDNIEQIIEDGQTVVQDLNSPRASIFTFSVGRNAQNGLMRQLACKHGGTWAPVTDLHDPLRELQGYISVLAAQRKTNDMIWSSFYIDDFGLGEMTTATMPLFSYNTSGPMKGPLIGIVGHDIQVSQLEQRGTSYEAVLGKVTDRVSACNVAALDVCPLQVIRGPECQCPDIMKHNTCYVRNSTGHVYYSAVEELTQGAAAEYCESHGGHLVELDFVDEIAFAAGLAGYMGSWIGLKLQGEGSWQWEGSQSHLNSIEKSMWAPGFQDTQGECASIDKRGAQKNVVRRQCSIKLPYICEFVNLSAASDICKMDEILYDEGDTSQVVPSMMQCLERHGIPGAAERESAEQEMEIEEYLSGVVCPLGVSKLTEEVVCCKNCSGGVSEFRGENHATKSAQLILVATSLVWSYMMLFMLT